ncbi:MAG TPA: hypothetical protein VGB75_10540 [Jatrophihabitans sp.]|jgi:selenide,water dikinase|uniref:hypothetical protein n=1 Tax=Jatrophihabitans sp. TaxID=1932789 RepID=UPI002EF86F7A
MRTDQLTHTPVRWDQLLLLADAQTSGGLLLAGEIATGGAAGLGPRGAVIGEFVPRQDTILRVR